jgi:uncharacterized membrane protein
MTGSMRRAVAALAIALAASGCRSAPPALGPSASLRAQVFACAEGPTFTLTRATGAAESIDMALDGSQRRMPQMRTTSGARYADGSVAIWTQSREATLERHGRVYQCREDRERSIDEDARIRGVDFRAVGHEPGWTLEVLAERLDFLGGYEPGTVSTPRPALRRAPATGETVYSAATEAHRIVVYIRESQCLDAPTGRRFEASVEVDLNGTAYRGCGQRVR